MSDHKQQLDAAMQVFNEGERREFMLTTAARWLGLDGPTYILGDIRVKVFFEDIHGQHWVDAMLAAASLAHIVGPGVVEGYRQAAACMDGVHDLWVCTDALGKWNATMAPVKALAAEWGYPPPVRLPEGDWARTWLTLPERTDEQEIAWIAHGGAPLYTDGGRL